MLKPFSRLMLATCVIVTGYAVSPAVPEAGARDITLQQWLQQRQGRQQPRATPQRQRQATQTRQTRQSAPRRTIRRVQSESYYAYKAPALAPVALASLLPDMETTGSIESLVAQSAQIVLPPMMMLEPEAPDVPVEANAPETTDLAEAATTEDGVNLPPMVLLEPVAPTIAPEPTPETDVAIEVPQSLTPPLDVLEPVAPRLASADYFAAGTSQTPDGSLRLESDVADAIRALYAERRDFIWSDGVEISDEARAVLAMLEEADSHGLTPDHYAVAMPDLDGEATDRAGALVAFDVTLTARAVRFARDLKDGFVDPNKLSGYHDFKDERLTAADAANDLAGANDAADWLASLAPQQPEYATLQAELTALADAQDDAIILPDRIMMRPGSDDEALPVVMAAIDRKLRDETRTKHSEALAVYDGGTVYDGALVDLVKDVQRDLGLRPDGIVGPQTAARLGGDSVQARVEKVRYAMERLRWHPEAYADRQVVINAPEYRVRYMENGETALAMNVIVGKKSNQTYFFHDEIETVVYNPYWGVPQSIIVNTYLPKLHRDSSYLDRNGFVVTTHGGKRLSSSSINWRQYSGPVPFNVRQKPGPSNALGELKILFPNEHAIYMHDTPAKELFGRDARAYSAGCVRLEDPRAMAAAVLGKDVDYVASQLGGYERAETVDAGIKVYVGYFTAWPNDDGKVSYHPDVYERDAHLKKAVDAVATARTG